MEKTKISSFSDSSKEGILNYNIQSENYIEDLVYLIKDAFDNNKPKPIIFLGAGASASAGIPLASSIVADIKVKYAEKPSIRRLIEEDNSDYYEIMEALTAEERRDLFYQYITDSKVKINVCNIYLAQLLKEGYIDYILTVNFDDLILRACGLYNFLPPVYDITNFKISTTSNYKTQSVIYLHGQHFGQWLLNSPHDLLKIEHVIPPLFSEIKNKRTWIVLGYSGQDEIFNHIKDLGSFTNQLFWVNYKYFSPIPKVSEFINDKHSNARLIKGYDADTFLMKLNSELKLSQPNIIAKPFTALKKFLDKIVDIEDKEHYRIVKERLKISQSNVNAAINQFEEGEKKEEQNEHNKINLLKQQSIDIIINNTFDNDDINELDINIRQLNNSELNTSLAEVYVNWGRKISQNAIRTKDLILYEKSLEVLQKAIILQSKDGYIYENIGYVLLNFALLKKDENLYLKSVENLETAIALDSKEISSFLNLGLSYLNLAILKNDEKLYLQSIITFKKALEFHTNNSELNLNLGKAYHYLAILKNDENLYLQSIDTIEIAIENNPNNDELYSDLGLYYYNLAILKNDENLYLKSIDTLEIAIKLNPNNDEAFSNLGLSYYNLAILRNDQNLYLQSINTLEIAIKLNPNYDEAYLNLGTSYFELAKFKDAENLYLKSSNYLFKAYELMGKCYNLSCLLAMKKEKIKALEYLNISLNKKEIEPAFVENDDDWLEFKNDNDFIALLNEFKSKII